MVLLIIYKHLFFLLCIMCGIFAVLKKWEYHPSTTYISSLEALKHRGPDESSFYEDDVIFLAHTRLAIVHPEAVGQPIHFRGWIGIMNGEIYNAKPGPNETDCHHLLQTIVCHGTKAIATLDGVFSFVLYHAPTQRMIVGRDAIGVTPLYYSNTIISSLLTCITDGTAAVVPPGHFADFTIGEVPIFQKWSSEYSAAPTTDAALSIVDMMYSAVSKRLMGDVPWGVLLSGGLDSAIVAGIAVDIAREIRPDYPTVHSFCIGLDQSPDVFHAKQLAIDLGTIHHSIEYTVEQGIAVLPDVIRAVETYDVTTIRAATPMWILARAISKRGIKMVLSGEGSDELFAGYLYNLYCPNTQEMVEECQRKVSQLYAYDCLRANKTMGDFGVEARVPFLDNKVVDFAMNSLSPVVKMSGTHPEGPKPEKWFLREAFKDQVPDSVRNRTKAQFSDAVGSEWIDGLQAYAECQVTNSELATACGRWPYQTPETKEALLYRKMFGDIFEHVEEADKTVIYQPSIACSTGQAASWHANFQKCLDPSGDAIQRAFE